ncbi:LysE family translocator [Pelagibius litoralis]|uniref:LysE family translocator n=1 Tax=Pelagibius litoralis TaxID=374515 RepID=A0A967F088_9PROT|nr:LysE family translocator [Pelagibius litoralis]NIA70674.1 LysE family translocator [Pelagibius litoralis]
MTFSMSLETFLAFVVAMSLLSLTPGPGFLAVVARSLGGGLMSGFATILGLILGDILFLILAIVGLSALAAAMGEFFLVVKILGAGYLIWLGIMTWRARISPPPAGVAMHKADFHRSFALGFVVTLGNPKTILFYSALVPTFIDMAALTLGDVALLSLVVALVSLVVLGAYAFLATRAGRSIKSPRAFRWLNRATGGLLVGAGVAVATR